MNHLLPVPYRHFFFFLPWTLYFEAIHPPTPRRVMASLITAAKKPLLLRSESTCQEVPILSNQGRATPVDSGDDFF